jgi:catechol 2,3-dioxygenase-like lactoylglutathione lyase family enzyme
MCSVNVRSLQHVQVNVPEAAAAEARRFYGDLLGLLEIERPRSLSDAGRKGIWYRIGEEQELHVFMNPGSFDASGSSQHPALVLDDLDALRRALEAAGYAIEEAIPIAGRERFFTRDPGGNRIEFLSFSA